MQTPCGSSRHGGKGHVDAGDPHIQKRQDHPVNKMHTLCEMKFLHECDNVSS